MDDTRLVMVTDGVFDLGRHHRVITTRILICSRVELDSLCIRVTLIDPIVQN
jgi:hypothetical protein